MIKPRLAPDDCQPMIPFSVLDLSPITEGSDAGQALHNSLDLARHVEALGYRRYWMAEHHNLPGIASAATAVALAHVAAGTASIRIGAGGIMLPNHAPLLIAEQFGALAGAYPYYDYTYSYDPYSYYGGGYSSYDAYGYGYY
jgi:Luciferase-like monooxygenase